MVAVAAAAASIAIIMPRLAGAEPVAAVDTTTAEAAPPLLQQRDTPALDRTEIVTGIVPSPVVVSPAPSLRPLPESIDWTRRALAFAAAIREALPQEAAAASPPAERPVATVATASVPPGRPVTVDAAVSPAPAPPTAQPEYFSPPSVVSAVASAPVTPPAPEALVLSPREEGLLREMNREREQFGLEPLVASATLTSIARARSRDMTELQYFGHFHPDGVSVYSLLQAAGVRYAAGGENLAKVAGDVEHSVQSAIEALMESDSHRENILNPRYRFIGVGSVTDDSGITILTAVFTDR